MKKHIIEIIAQDVVKINGKFCHYNSILKIWKPINPELSLDDSEKKAIQDKFNSIMFQHEMDAEVCVINLLRELNIPRSFVTNKF